MKIAVDFCGTTLQVHNELYLIYYGITYNFVIYLDTANEKVRKMIDTMCSTVRVTTNELYPKAIHVCKDMQLRRF